ncbi:DNA-binding CsgD family transcriptional regulator [Duganella sp. 1224]|uniref:helix-turn-helix transcriptional regulator n=1 Tax=Duganella sp. 1224 TaxID=2587052 RepID=UPI0015C7C245|nr:LuxR C-terminal-related transcriptional regulator [Duganella sp. 1224]NYE62553.1 DNA-binding CsgD family transcriptional regulator [Duganella sp. 1224]
MDYNDYLLQLYRGTREVPVDEFPAFAFAATAQVLTFDSARIMSLETGDANAVVHASLTHNEPDSLHLDWEAISSLDTVLQSAMARPHQAYAYTARDLFAGSGYAVVRDYADRYRHANGLVLAAQEPQSGYWEGLSLFRAREASLFSAADERLLQALAPHFRQALAISRSRDTSAGGGACAMAVVTPSGDLEYCTPQFVRLVNLECPSWRGQRLPDRVMAALSRVGVMAFRGARVKMRVRRHRGLLFVYAMTDQPLARLSERELMVARLFSQGYSHKEVARALQIAPATARNFIQKIYDKLEVRDKAALALRIGPADA